MVELSNGNGVSDSRTRPDTVTLSRKAWNWLVILGSAFVLAASSVVWTTVRSVDYHDSELKDIREDDERLENHIHDEISTLRMEIAKLRDWKDTHLRERYVEHNKLQVQISRNSNHIATHEAQCAERHERENRNAN